MSFPSSSTTPASAPDAVAATTLARVLEAVTEDAVFAIGQGLPTGELEQLGKRRHDAYANLVAGRPAASFWRDYDAHYLALVRSLAPIHTMSHLPMADLFATKLTLEVGARGLRSLFSSKPSDKDVQRVKRVGTLAARVLRTVFSADGALRPDESLQLAAFVHGLGLGAEDEQALLAEQPVDANEYELYGDIDPQHPRAIVRGAWLAATVDGVDEREDALVRRIAAKLGIAEPEVETMRSEVTSQVERRKYVGFAALDAVRYVLSGAEPERTKALSLAVGALLLPELHREEGLGPIRHEVPVALGKRHKNLSDSGRSLVLALAWAAALGDDPSLATRAVRRTRHERLGQDLGLDGTKLRAEVDRYVAETLAPFAHELVTP